MYFTILRRTHPISCLAFCRVVAAGNVSLEWISKLARGSDPVCGVRFRVLALVWTLV